MVQNDVEEAWVVVDEDFAIFVRLSVEFLATTWKKLLYKNYHILRK